MTDSGKVAYSRMEAGFEFPPSTIRLDAAAVALYVEAVEETSSLYQDRVLVPPSAVAAYAQAALAEKIDLLPGTIHVSLEAEFLAEVNVGGTITCHARVNRKQERGKIRLLSIDLEVLDGAAVPVMKGKTSFMLPEAG